MDIDVLDFALFVNDKNRPLRPAVIAQNAVSLGDPAMREEVTQKGVGYVPQAL